MATLCLFVVATRTDLAMGQLGRETAPVAALPQVARIDQHVQAGWKEYGLVPSAPASDGEFCRRLFLDVLGRIPTCDELTAYLSDRSGQKRMRLAKRLLYDAQYTDEYVRNWTTIWTNLLIGRSGGRERNSLTDRQGLQQYLREALRENRPYDRIVHELIAATGTNKPEDAEFNGAVNFLLDKLQDGATQATAQTAQLFLGMQVQCTQCHNHPFNDWKQNQFWELNAFFRQAVPLRRYEPGTGNIRLVELADQDFAGENATFDPKRAGVYYELRNGTVAVAYPVFVDGTGIPTDQPTGIQDRDGRFLVTSGYLQDVNRRQALAEKIVHSEYLAPALVNRLWAHFFGYGFTRPVDDMGPHNPPSHPELLAYLAEEFQRHSYDLKQLTLWMVLSEPYGLSSRMTSRNATDDPQLGQPPQFSHFYLRQMRAEELYESLLWATQAHMTSEDPQQREEQKAKWLEQFTIAFGTDEGDETTTFNGTIPQTLMMFNGELIQQAVQAGSGSFLHRVATDEKLSPTRKIERLYLAALARRPSQGELRLANQLLAARQGDITAALQDVWWALLNSNEFILNH